MYRSVCALLLFAVSVSATKLNFKHAEEKCRNETGMSESLTSLIPRIIFENPETKCFAACMLREGKLVNANGTVNLQFLEDSYKNNTAAVEAFRNCANQTAEDFCETAARSFLCLDDALSRKQSREETKMKCRNEWGIMEFGINDPNTKCYIGCLLRESEGLKADGTINLPFFEFMSMDYPNRNTIIEALTSCTNQSAGNFCEMAAKSIACLYSVQLLERSREESKNKCRNELGIKEFAANSNDLKTFINGPNTKCYMGCMLRENGKLNADGTINLRLIKSTPSVDPHRNVTIEALTSCTNHITGNFCETAAKSFECLYSVQVLYE